MYGSSNAKLQRVSTSQLPRYYDRDDAWSYFKSSSTCLTVSSCCAIRCSNWRIFSSRTSSVSTEPNKRDIRPALPWEQETSRSSYTWDFWRVIQDRKDNVSLPCITLSFCSNAAVRASWASSLANCRASLRLTTACKADAPNNHSFSWSAISSSSSRVVSIVAANESK